MWHTISVLKELVDAQFCVTGSLLPQFMYMSVMHTDVHNIQSCINIYTYTHNTVCVCVCVYAHAT